MLIYVSCYVHAKNYRVKNQFCALSVALAYGALLIASPLTAVAQTAAPGDGDGSAPAAECRKRFRLAEISAQVPHEPGSMQEVCMTVANSCVKGDENSKDCRLALANIAKLIGVSISSRDARLTKTK